MVFRGHPYTILPRQESSRLCRPLDVLLINAMQCSHPDVANHMSRMLPMSRSQRPAGVLFLPLKRIQPLIHFYRDQLAGDKLTSSERLVSTALGVGCLQSLRKGKPTAQLGELEPDAPYLAAGTDRDVAFLTLHEPDKCLTALPERVQRVAIPPFIVAVDALAAALGFSEVYPLRHS
jgi:hypothetical protein